MRTHAGNTTAMHRETATQTAKPAEIRTDQANHPLLTVGSLVLCDLITLTLCGTIAVWGYLALRGNYHPWMYVRLWPCLLLFPVCHEVGGLYHGIALYPGVALGPAEEIRRLSISTTIAYLLLGLALFLSKQGPVYSRGVFLIAWSLSLPALPAARALARHALSPKSWWGIRCVIFGSGEPSRRVIRTLASHPEFGLKPVAVFATPGKEAPVELEGIPVTASHAAAVTFASRENISYAIVADPQLPPAELLQVLEKPGRHFRHILIIPEVFGTAGVWATPRDIGTMFGLEIRQNLLLPLPRQIKRCMDLALVLLLATPAILCALGIAILIRLGSKGPALFRQTRLGMDNTPFGMWKFRTMYNNSHEILATHLQHNPPAQVEWERHHKLTNDPRVTPLGRFLRRTSLDELPQLYNVLKGDMSIVGPRPIVAEEVPEYGDVFDLYTRVPPGLTGLWQVSGRNDLTFKERVELDAFYVRNWSVWLDLYVLSRTLPAILGGQGAF